MSKKNLLIHLTFVIMALRNQPYFPLYVQDYLTDEKLNLCSLAAQGLYIKILCLLHKQQYYGSILFHQNNKQNLNKFDYFVDYMSKQLPIQKNEIKEYLEELINEKVLVIDEEKLYQKRMLKDGKISEIRAKIGSEGGGSKLNKQYGKNGLLYFLSDGETKHKIGVTSNLKQRVYQIRSKNKLSKLFNCVSSFEVKDMGKVEDKIKEFFNKDINGEWINLHYNEALNKFNLFHQKLKQNPEYENEYENEFSVLDNIQLNAEKNIYEVFPEIISDQIWIESICMNHRLSKLKVVDYLAKFELVLKGDGIKRKSIQNTQQHFNRWLAIELKNNIQTESDSTPDWVKAKKSKT